jgi:tetratricopeptide (TPR) repeat protein
VVNRAKGGIAIQKVARIARKVRGDADAVLLYAGNNQFLRFDDKHDLSARPRRLLDEPTVTREQRDAELRRFQEELEGLIEYLTGRGVPLIISSVAVNLSDWEPNRSALEDASHGARVAALLETADGHLESGRTQEAVSAYQELLSFEPGFALAHMRLADVYRSRDESDLARSHYRKAADHDANPYRVLSEQNRILERVAAERGVPFVDAARILEEAADDGLVGFNLIWDNCHPTLQGYGLIAEGFARALNAALGLGRELRPVEPDAVFEAFGLDERDQLRFLRNSGQYCYGASTLTFDPEARLKCAERYLRAAEEIDPDDPDLLCSFAVLHALRGDLAECQARARRAHGLDPERAEARLTNPRVREILEGLGVDDPLTLVR